MPILEPRDADWNYVAITNDGVIPGWDGGHNAAKAVESDTPPTKDRQDYLDLCPHTRMTPRRV